MKRLFLGIRVSVHTANALAQCAETLARRARDAKLDINWIAPTNYHVTLKFLGATRDEAVGAVRDAVTDALAGMQRFAFRCARLGAFPSLEKASVLWAGIEEPTALGECAKRIELATSRLGFANSQEPRNAIGGQGGRSFHAHVTLGRVRETRPLREVVLPMSEQMFSDTRVDAVTLFESETKPSGSVYKELHRISFKPAPDLPERQTSTVELGDETDDGWPRGHGQ